MGGILSWHDAIMSMNSEIFINIIIIEKPFEYKLRFHVQRVKLKYN